MIQPGPCKHSLLAPREKTHHGVTMCSVADGKRLRMKAGAVTLLSKSKQTCCGCRRSQKGGSHGKDKTRSGPRTRGMPRAGAADAGNGGEHGHRRVALEAGVLRAVEQRRA